MTEEEAIAALNVPHETFERLSAFVALLREENHRQNLVSRGTLGDIWTRHIYDSAQLCRFAPSDGSWVDLGTGAGFPGLIVATLREGPVTMVEPRALRVDFLQRAAAVLGIEDRVEILCARANVVPARPFDVISARAFAPLHKLLLTGLRFSSDETIWVLPKGRNAQSELDAVRSSWQGDFRVEPSLTDPEAGIIVAQGVKPRGKKGR